jgi:hypothetical protein
MLPDHPGPPPNFHGERDILVAYILFGDRCPPACLEAIIVDTPILPTDNYLDRGTGAAYLATILEQYRVTLSP